MGGGYKSSLHHFSAKLRFEVFWLSEQGLCSLFLLLVAPGYYNTIQVLEAIALHLDSVNGKLASGRTLYRASFVFFLTRLLTMRIAYHVLMPKEIKHWKLSVNFLHSFLSDLQENHGRSDADGGCTIISVKTPMQQKPWQVIWSCWLPRRLVLLIYLGQSFRTSKQLGAMLPSKKLWMKSVS